MDLIKELTKSQIKEMPAVQVGDTERENFLHADAIRHAADSDRLLNAAVLLGNDDALVYLDKKHPRGVVSP